MKKCKEIAVKICKVCRITDENGLVSLTNVTMMVVIAKVIMTPTVSMQDLTALAIGVMGYQAKRVVQK